MSVVVLAGRRIDGQGTNPPRFPAANVPIVGARLHRRLIDLDAQVVVGSAACGADLLALSAAADLRIRRRVVLPFEAERFRRTSVTDRPGPWGPLFDRIVREATAANDLIVLEAREDELAAYRETSARILDEARALAGELSAEEVGLLVWEGESGEPNDMTALFRDLARARGLRIVQISTV